MRELANLFNELQDKKVDCGIVAMENSVAGSLLQNLNLLRESGLTVWASNTCAWYKT
ncbi:MAG: prephenate dehydratase domain-containing protein [Bacteroidales bacterium]